MFDKSEFGGARLQVLLDFQLKAEQMRKHRIYLLFFAAFVLVTGCFKSPNYMAEMPQSSEHIVPAIGGSYSFDVAMILTKLHVGDNYQNFEYRVSIDGVVIFQDIVNRSPDAGYYGQNIEDIVNSTGRYLRVSFTVPENPSSGKRNIVVETLTAKDYAYYEEHVDPGINTWVAVWTGTQDGV